MKQENVINVKKFLNNPSLYANDSMPVIIPRSHVQDIDTLEDWDNAELIFDLIKKQSRDK